jgi:hypothetical protein
MKEILANPYYSAIVVLFSQIIFIYLRTLNVIYTAERRMIPSILSGNGIGLAWLVSMSIGADSIMQGQPLPIATFLIGGTLGTYWGIKKESKKDKLEE